MFSFRSGAPGSLLFIVSFPKQRPDQLTEEAANRIPSVTAATIISSTRYVELKEVPIAPARMG